MKKKIKDSLLSDAILRIGVVSAVTGQNISIKIDKEKNTSDLFFNGDLIRNVSVGSFVKIRKGFLSLIGKVDGEKIEETLYCGDKFIRTLDVSLVGFLNPLNGNKFEGGLKELPLIGNEAYIITNYEMRKIYDLTVKKQGINVSIGKTPIEGMDVLVDIDKLFGSHIAIFGNTGSGKSNTLAKLYSELLNNSTIKENSVFKKKCKYLLLDFNGEYSSENCITDNKLIYKLSTRNVNGGDKVKISREVFLDLNIFSIISQATEKTQRPFIKRTLDFYSSFLTKDDKETYYKNIVKKKIEEILKMTDKEKAYTLLDYVKNILMNHPDENLLEDIEWHNQSGEFKRRGTQLFFGQNPCEIYRTAIYTKADTVARKEYILDEIIDFLYLQLIHDVLSNRAVNEHIAPVINRLISIQKDLNKVLDICENSKIFGENNFVVVDLKNVKLEFKKLLPLLISKHVYDIHKDEDDEDSILNIIIDEAHNILSEESFRESESWKDYRLETFEEIIKEGRKFGVFITISSQRPSDISHTIISQAHNYFIHRLLNQNDLHAVSSSISYIDKITAESIPTLPVGTCIFNGISTQMPMLVAVDKLVKEKSPNSENVSISKIIAEGILADLI